MAHSLSEQILTITCLLCIYFLCNHANCDTLDNFGSAVISCGVTNTVKASQTYKNNVNSLYSNFVGNSSQKLYYNTTVGDGPDKVFGYYMCRGDLPSQACRTCLVNATQLAQTIDCKYQDFYLIPNSDCVLGYTNRSMQGKWDSIMSVNSPLGVNKYDYEQYNQTVLSTMQVVINEAASANDTKLSPVLGFANKTVNLNGDEKLYALAQCTPDLLSGNCSHCLTNLLSGVSESYYQYQGVDAVEPKCLFRFYYRSLIDDQVAKPDENEAAKVLSNGGLVALYSSLLLFLYYTFLG